jgi:phospholipid/cholesterol/gamma-HCH transport system substrate-binding protein
MRREQAQKKEKPVAITSPPRPSVPPPPPDGLPERPARTGAGPRRAARYAAFGALGAVVVVVAYLVLAGGGGADYHLELKEAGQLVRGDQVQVAGVPAGSVTNIVLTKDFKALITIHVESSVTPLHEGTVAQIRVPSLTGVANRFVELTPGPKDRPALPNGATLSGSETKEVVDLDTLFNTLNPKTRKGLQQFIQGTAEQYAGAGPALAEDVEYFGPSLGATNHFFAELVRDQSTFTHFVVASAKALTVIAAHKEALEGLIEHGSQTFQALGAHQEALTEGLRQLPVTLAQGNRTFAQLSPTVRALTRLVNVSKPNTKHLALFFEKLRPLLTTATPAVTNFREAISKPGPNNDLTDLLLALPKLAEVLTTASPNGVKALRESLPITAFFGPYSPDLTGLFRTFGQTTAYYDANGHFARFSPVAPSFKLGANNNLTPSSAQQALEGLTTGQLRRCPGAATQPSADRSAPFTNNGALSCDPSETP